MSPRFEVRAAVAERSRENFYIGGRWCKPRSNRRLELISPVTEECLLTTPEASREDVDQAVSAARTAFDQGPWPSLAPRERARFLRAIAQGLRRRRQLLCDLWTLQVGAPTAFADYLIDFAPALYDYYATLADVDDFAEVTDSLTGRAMIFREPVGVAAIISPWNAPLILLSYGVAAALAAGCTVIAKPSPETPLDAQILAECAEEAGLPDGVLNVVPGGRDIGAYLVERPQVDKVGFTGSTSAGRHIASACANRFARVSLELGGKSPAILAEDVDITAALQTLVPFSMPFAGQICFSLTRVLVPHARRQEITDAYASAVKTIAVGDPWLTNTQMGPVSMKRQYERVLGYIRKGLQEGAQLAAGGDRVLEQPRGYFIAPTVFAGVSNQMSIAREEIFGPVVSLISYRSEEEAIAIANASDFGLSGAVFTRDPERGLAIARRLRTGNVTINGLRVEPHVPFGGFKHSGIGRVGGPDGLRAYQEVKAVYI